MGVSGSGKTLVGKWLGNSTAFEFIDGDDLHPPGNIARMKSGQQLDDAARKPWLAAIVRRAEIAVANGDSLIVACSALKQSYRDQLRSIAVPVYFVFLDGSQALIETRLANREGHFMPSQLLRSQFDDLQSPVGEVGVISVDIDQSVESVCQEALSGLKELTTE
ncbi:gluconokinase [Mariniblastus sp.]|nr:gluconokinase [bacterium]MDB4372216.1 gluconokinase [Mariniblastus sp.]